MPPRRPLGDTQRERDRREPVPRERDPVAAVKDEPQTVDAKEIERQIKKDAVQNPLSISAFLMCGLAVIYLLFVAPFVGGGQIAFFTAICSGAIGLCLGGWKWLAKKSCLDKKIQELAIDEEKKRKEGIKEKLIQRRMELKRGFEEIDFTDGLKELKELTAKYLELVTYLGRRPESKLISNSQVIDGMTETYQQGLNILGFALEIMRTVRATDIASLEGDMQDIQRELAREKIAEIKVIKQETLESHKKRIEKVREQTVYAVKLLAQSDKCEAALHQTMLDLNMLDIEGSEEKAKEVVERIRGNIKTAIAVQEALKEKGLNV